MPNIDTSGLGRIGRSMDYSMALKLKKSSILVASYQDKMATGFGTFMRDQKTRGFDAGLVTILFEKGLENDITKFISKAISEVIPYVQEELPDLSILDGGAVGGWPAGTPILEGGDPTRPTPVFTVGYL
jgi:hypothetical protein